MCSTSRQHIYAPVLLTAAVFAKRWLHALVSQARLQNTHVPLLESLAWSNRIQIDHAYEIIAQAVHSKEDAIGFLGLSFKAGTDDLRESPIVELVERFIGKGYRLLLYDKYVSLTRLMGTNKQYIQQEIPHLSQLMSKDVAHVLRMSKVLVVVNRNGPYVEALAQADASTRIICLRGYFEWSYTNAVAISWLLV